MTDDEERRAQARADGVRLLHLLAEELESGRRDGYMILVVSDNADAFIANGYCGTLDVNHWREYARNCAISLAADLQRRIDGDETPSNPLPWDTKH